MSAFDVKVTQAELLALAAWAQRKKREMIENADNQAAAIAGFQGLVTHCPAYTTAVYWRRTKAGEVAVAKGAPSRIALTCDLQRKKARALPMNAYNGIAT